MNTLKLFLSIILLISGQTLFAQSNCGTALVIDPCSHTPTQYSPVGDDASFNQGSCDFDGDDAIWISFTVNTLATSVTITLSDWGGCGIFCNTDMTGAFYSGSCGTLSSVNNCIDLTTGITNGTNLGPWTFPVSFGTTYYFRLSEEDDDGGFAELLFEFDNCIVPLPVSLSNFAGTATEKSNIIQWETASEENTDWHILERSADGQEGWEELGRLPAMGYSTSIEQYEWEDQKPMTKAYYRLVTQDISGEKSYSEVIVIERPFAQISLDRIYPNPTSAEITIEYSTIEKEEVLLQVYDLTGRLLGSEEQVSSPGKNEIIYGLDQYPDGRYLIRLITATEQFNQQVVLQR